MNFLNQSFQTQRINNILVVSHHEHLKLSCFTPRASENQLFHIMSIGKLVVSHHEHNYYWYNYLRSSKIEIHQNKIDQVPAKHNYNRTKSTRDNERSALSPQDPKTPLFKKLVSLVGTHPQAYGNQLACTTTIRSQI